MHITHQYSQVNDWFFQTLEKLFHKQTIVTILLSGGHSLDGWYADIVRDIRLNTLQKNKLTWGLVDERIVPPHDTYRNDRYVWDTFLEPAGFCPEQLKGLGGDVDALEYSEVVGHADIAIFGLGPDGHLASLFPQHPALQCQVDGYITLHDSPKPPAERITLTLPAIQKISHTALFVVGPEKQRAFDDFMNAEKTIFDCPVKILTPDIIFQG